MALIRFPFWKKREQWKNWSPRSWKIERCASLCVAMATWMPWALSSIPQHKTVLGVFLSTWFFSILDTTHYFVTLFWKGILWKLGVSAQEQNCCDFCHPGLDQALTAWSRFPGQRILRFHSIATNPILHGNKTRQCSLRFQPKLQSS